MPTVNTEDERAEPSTAQHRGIAVRVRFGGVKGGGRAATVGAACKSILFFREPQPGSETCHEHFYINYITDEMGCPQTK